MTYNEYMKEIATTQNNLVEWYGDFGIELNPMWDGNTAFDITIAWPSTNNNSLDSTYRFAEALSAAAFEAAKLVNITVD